MQVGLRERISALTETNVDDLFSYFARRVTPRDEAADLVGETMLVVWRRAGDAPTDDLRARMWIFGIARHVLMNHERGRRRRIVLTSRIRDDIVAGTTSPDADGESVELRLAIRRLPPKQREVIFLVYGEGFTLVEAGKIMNVSASTTRSRHSYALSALRSHLSPVDGIDHALSSATVVEG
ncbi:RNA polymerase sigma-70 factor (ECF subfamily) [Conyzicola lurida]|uniref:RNA polymerase sigma-70 factor (ECF subfamily) n=1 Tax=Conyzicola lurida TaxID=1172621 RepID=A0A841ALQ4_9MICO|nr:sigma-70 family RNA polymerase sigma factor [Conyzicola lurida]MBB5842646.1 RNA polymerase sigma-70 factor (ECF subfamily) [Conyzicola lurida]